jgi:hypothetical protein
VERRGVCLGGVKGGRRARVACCRQAGWLAVFRHAGLASGGQQCDEYVRMCSNRTVRANLGSGDVYSAYVAMINAAQLWPSSLNTADCVPI